MAYLNFILEVTELPNGQVRIQATLGDEGASVDTLNPFDLSQIAQVLFVLGREQPATPAEELALARQFGEALFNFLIMSSSDISRAYFAALDRAAREGFDGVRFRLAVERSGLLAQLPWELLYDPQRYFLAPARLTPIVRFRRMLNTRPPAPTALPLRVLVVIAAPTTRIMNGETLPVPPLDSEGEWSRLQAAVKPLERRGMIQLERLDVATLPELRSRLRSGAYHVVHYIGHSEIDSDNRAALLFENQDDHALADMIDGAALGLELAQETTLRLVVLNSCHSARRVDEDVFAGIASALVAQGLPAVIAMQFPITDRAAGAFSEEFYKALADYLPIDAAVSDARRAISDRVRNAEFATPVLYMRGDDGTLFRQPDAPPNAARPVLRLSPATLGVASLVIIALLALLTLIVQPFLPTPVPTQTVPPLIPTPAPTVPAGQADLQIGTIRVSPSRPAPGQLFFFNFTVRNAGSADSGAFNIVWDASLLPPLQLNAHSQRVDNIPAGTSKSISFPFTYGWWGTYNSQLTVDIDAEVDESDRRNNRQPFTIEIATDAPFEIDFTRLPNNSVIAPPQPFPRDAYDLWGLRFGIPANIGMPIETASVCAAAPLSFIELDDGEVAAALDPACVGTPMSIVVTRRVVSAMAVEIVPQADGEARLTYYADTAGTRPLLTTPAVPLNAGVRVTLSAASLPEGARRLDIVVPDQIVRLSRLTLRS